MPLVKFKPTSPGRRQLVKFVNPDLHKGGPYQPLVEKQSKKATQRRRPHHGAPPGSGHKQNYRSRFSPQQRTALRPRSSGSIRSEPEANLASFASRRRAPPIIAPKGVAGEAQLVSGWRRRSSRVIPCRCEHPGRHYGSLHRDAARRKCTARRARGHSVNCSPRGQPRSCGCVRARSARCTSTAAPPSVRSATKAQRRSARPARASAGAACGPPCAASR